MWFDVYEFEKLEKYMDEREEETENDQWMFYSYALPKLGFTSFDWDSEREDHCLCWLDDKEYLAFLLRFG